MDDLFHSLVATGHGTPTHARPDATATALQGIAFGAAFTAVTMDAGGTETPQHSSEEVVPDLVLVDSDNGPGTPVIRYGPQTIPENPAAVDGDLPALRLGTAPDADIAVRASPINIAISAQIAGGSQVLGNGVFVQTRPNTPALDGPLTLPISPTQPSQTGASWTPSVAAAVPTDVPSSLAQVPQTISPPERQIYNGPSVLPTAHAMDRADQMPPIGPLVLPKDTQPTPLTIPVAPGSTLRASPNEMPLTIPTDDRGGPQSQPLTIPTSAMRTTATDAPQTLPTAPGGASRVSPNEMPLTIPTDTRGGPQSQPLTIPTSTVRATAADAPQTLPVADRPTPPMMRTLGVVPGDGARVQNMSTALTTPTAPIGLPQTSPTLVGASRAVPTHTDTIPTPAGQSGTTPGRVQTSAATGPEQRSAETPKSPLVVSQGPALQIGQAYSAAPPPTSAAIPQSVELSTLGLRTERAQSSDLTATSRDALPARIGGWTVAPSNTPAPFILAPTSAQPLLGNVAAAAMPEVFSDALPDLEFSLHAALSSISTTALTPTTSLLAHAPSATAQVIAQQISAALNNSSTGKDGPLELALDPPELGRVRMLMTEIAGVMTLTIQAERPETADLMRRHLDLLAQEFAQAGLDAPSVHISQEGADQREQTQPETASEEGPSQAASSDADAPPRPSQLSASGGLDLRL